MKENWVVTFKVKVPVSTYEDSDEGEVKQLAVENLKMFRWNHRNASDSIVDAVKVDPIPSRS